MAVIANENETGASLVRPVKRTLRRKVLALFSLIVLIQGGFLLTLLGLLDNTEKQLKEERHTRDVVAAIARYISTLQTTSISLINQIRYEDIILDEYKAIFDRLPSDFENLKKLLESDSDAASRVRELESTTIEALDLIGKVNSSYRERGLSEQSRMMHNHYCIQLIDCSRSMTRQIEELESIYRQRQTMLGRALLTQSDDLFFVVVTLGFAVNAIVAIAIYLFFVKGITGRLNIVKENTLNLVVGKPLLEPVSGEDEVALLDSEFREMSEKIDAVKSKESVILEHAANFICSINRKSVIESVPEVCSAMWGYRADELLGRRLNSILVGEQGEGLTSILASLSESHSSANFENQVRCADGTLLDLVWSANLYDDGSIICIAQDVTQAKKYTAQLRASEERFRTMEERLPIAVVSCDRNFVIESVNAAVTRTFRYQPNELLGKRLDLLLVNPAWRKLQAGAQVGLGQFGEDGTTEINVWRRDGEQFTAEVMVALHNSSRGDRYLVCFRDVSARIELDLAKRDFVSMVSHDLRSPLTSLHGTLSMISESKASDADSDNVFIKAASMVSLLVELINDFLDIGKIESGQEHFLLVECDLEEILVRGIELSKKSIPGRSVSIEIDRAEPGMILSLRNTTIKVDYDRIVRSIACLLEVIICSNPSQSLFFVKVDVAEQIKIRVGGVSCILPQSVKDVVDEGYALVEFGERSSSSPLSLALCRTVLRAHRGALAIKGGLTNEWFEVSLPLG